jgi:hypothetical protein
MTETSTRLLQTARTLIAQGWTQIEYARDAQGRRVRYDTEEAVQFCLLGAARRAAEDIGGHLTGADLDAVAELLGFAETEYLIAWNDAPDRTQADVLARLDAALGAE